MPWHRNGRRRVLIRSGVTMAVVHIAMRRRHTGARGIVRKVIVITRNSHMRSFAQNHYEEPRDVL